MQITCHKCNHVYDLFSVKYKFKASRSGYVHQCPSCHVKLIATPPMYKLKPSNKPKLNKAEKKQLKRERMKRLNEKKNKQ